jgi:signal transduction histidine kinase
MAERLFPPLRWKKTGRVVRRTWHILAAFLTLAATLGADAAEPKRVMLLYSFGRDFKPWSDYATTIRTELTRQSPWPIDITEHSLVAARFSDENPELPFVAYLEALFSKRPPDLIVSLGAPAAAFVQRHRSRLFPKTPMVFTAVERRRVQYSNLTDNDAVVAVHIDYRRAIENILQVLPGTKNVAVVVGTSPIEQFWRKEIDKETQPLRDRIAFRWYDQMPFESALKDASTLPPHSAIFWELMLVDAAGVVYEGDTALAKLHAVANAPVFSYDESFFGQYIVGGPLLSVREGSRQTAAVAVRILAGEKPADIKIPAIEFSTPKFDWREMRRWGIKQSDLPLGSEVLFRDPTVWDLYRWQIMGICTVILLQAALISWLLYEREWRRRSQREAHDLSGRLIKAHEEERERLARELHDDVSQRLAALAIDAAQYENSPSASASTTQHSIHQGLVRLSEDVHGLSYQLHPSILADLGLVEALNSECKRYPDEWIELRVNETDIPAKLPHDVALCLFRIAQEALRNASRHAKANRVQVSLSRVGQGLKLTIADDGIGFDPGEPRKGTSLGLASMRQRATSVRGRFEVKANPHGGTTISAWVPIR